MKIFLDNCILSVSSTMQGTVKRSPLWIGEKKEWIDVVGYMRKPLPDISQRWKREQIECLPTVGKAAENGLISLCTYFEIQNEFFRGSGTFPRPAIGDIFSNAKISHLESPIERSYFFQMPLQEYSQTSVVIQFCKWLLSAGVEDLSLNPTIKQFLPGQMLRNLKNVNRFREICKGLSEKQYPDALHLWAAEINNAEVFLTIDGKFIRAMTQSKKIDLPCKPMPPSDLITILGLKHIEPFEFKEGVFYDIAGRRV